MPAVSSNGCGGLAKNQSRLSISPTSWWQEKMDRPSHTWPLVSGYYPHTKSSKATCSTVRKNSRRSYALSIENCGGALEPKMRHCVSLARVNLYPRRFHFLIHFCCRVQRLNGKRRRESLEKLSGIPRPR